MKTNPQYLTFTPEYDTDLAKIKNFLLNFNDSPRGTKHLKYMELLQQIANKDLSVLEIHTEDLEAFFVKDTDMNLLQSIFNNTKRYINLFYEAVDAIMPSPTKQLQGIDLYGKQDEIITHQRLQNIGATKDAGSLRVPTAQSSGIDVTNVDGGKHRNLEGIPKELLRHYELVIVPGPGSKQITYPMRDLKATQIGSLVSIKGIVIRATDIKPFLKVACYSCDICGYENYQVITGRTYMPLTDCASEQCRNNRSHGRISQMNRTSKFVSFQEIKIQEPPNEVPVGHVPRSLTVFALGQCVRKCAPGDTVTITGIYLPSMIQGVRTHRSRLIHDTYIEAFKIVKEKKSYKDTKLDDRAWDELKKSNQDYALYDKLSTSIAPEIYGMDDIKKALLLLLVGGVDKEMDDGMKIRGNINILLMGDPGIAKSQLLKYISHISPRGVYTTGKGSSGVGLTAAVVKDPITNDLVLEGGALVLADMGVCCIDEFDKMSDYDRANIHEVMEQQTVSIAKAGITTRLNARASVLAAANPLYGRYNVNLSPHENINLPAALLSRFDLIFLLLDIPDPERDRLLAEHVTFVHQHSKAPELKSSIFDATMIRGLIAQAKTMKPIIPKDLHNFIIQKYVEKRKEESEQTKQGYQYITPRSLLAIIRLAQALAKLRLGDTVKQEDVDEALRLLQVSKASVDIQSQVNDKGIVVVEDVKSKIFKMVRELCMNNEDKTCSMSVIEKRVIGNGFTAKQLHNMIDNYVMLNILYVDIKGNEVTLL
jgi:DNA replication licensing factor MCM7